MESTDDDFGDLYADVEVQASSAINGALEPSNLCSGVEKDDFSKRPSGTDFDKVADFGGDEENGSDSEDDFDIVLNDDNGDGLEFAVNQTVAIRKGWKGENEDKEGKEEIEEVKEFGGFKGKSRMVLDHLQGGEGGEHRLNGGKGGNSQYKYTRPQPSTLASTSKNSKCKGPASYSCPSVKGELEDNMCYHGMRPRLLGGQSVHQFSLPRSRTIVDVNIDAFDEKPWRHPGADITDYFNFDFDEDTWKNYCNHLDRYRHGDISPARVLTSDFSKYNEFYESRTDHETVAQTAAEKTQKQRGRMFRNCKSPGKEQEHSNMHKGRAIQVAGSITERQSSMDTRRLIDRDSDVVIQIDVQESKKSGTSMEQVDRMNSSEQGAYENGTSGTDDAIDGLTFGSSSEDDLYRESIDGDAFDEGSDMPNSKRCSVQKHPHEEAALCDSEGNTKTVGTSNKSKEEASRSTCNAAPTILEAEYPHKECYQYSRSPSFLGSDCEDFSEGAHIDVEKSYNYVKRPAPNSLIGLQKSAIPDYHHSKGFKSRFGKIKYRDYKDAARYGNPIQENRSLNGISRSKSYSNGYQDISNSVTDRDYGHHLEHDRSRQEDKLYGYSGYLEDEFLYHKERKFSFNVYDEGFPDHQIEDVCTKYPRKKGYQRFKVATNRVLPRNSDKWAYRLHDDMIERRMERNESSFTADSMHPLTYQESRQLDLNYPENEIDTRWKTRGEPQFIEGIRDNIEFSPERKYFRDSPQQKYKRTGPYDVRGRNNFSHEYEERLPYSRRGAKSSGRSIIMEDEDDFWRSGHHRSFSSRPYGGTHTVKRRWHSTSSPKSHSYERNGRQERYEKHMWTGRSQDIDINGGDIEAFNTEKYVNDHDDQAYSSVRRYHRQSELLHWSEDEGLSKQHNNNYHAETTSFSCKTTSWNKRFNAGDRTGHIRNLTYDMQVDLLNCKWMSDGDTGKEWDRSSDIYYGGDHDQALLRCGDSVDLHLVHGEGKPRGRSSAAGSVMFNGKYNNKACNSVDGQQSMFKELDKTRTKMARPVKDPDVNISQKDESSLNVLSDAQQKALDIEEGQILTDDIMEDAMNNNISVSGNLSQSSAVKSLHKENATKKSASNKECGNPRILEVIAKMEKRRERFKEPITLKGKFPEPPTGSTDEPPTGSTDDVSGTTKQQRPARKRRWGGH